MWLFRFFALFHNPNPECFKFKPNHKTFCSDSQRWQRLFNRNQVEALTGGHKKFGANIFESNKTWNLVVFSFTLNFLKVCKLQITQLLCCFRSSFEKHFLLSSGMYTNYPLLGPEILVITSLVVNTRIFTHRDYNCVIAPFVFYTVVYHI